MTPDQQIREAITFACTYECGCDDPGNPQKCLFAETFAALDRLVAERDEAWQRADALEATSEQAAQIRRRDEALRAAEGREAALREAGEEFLTAYVNASVSDEEGLLAAVDQREWTKSWQAVDDAAQAFGTALAAVPAADPARAVGISDEPLSEGQMARAIRRSADEGWKEIKP